MTWPQGGDPYGQQQPPPPGGYDPYAQQQSAQPYSGQPYSGQPYSVQPYAQAPYYPPAAAAKTNTMAILSLVFSLVSLFIIPILAAILGVIFGHVGKKQIKETGEGGDGLATAGLVIGYISLGLWVIGCGCYVAFVLGLMGLGAAGSSSSDYVFILQALTL